MNAPSNNEHGLAIVGMAGRFPKARNIDEFWRNLCAGVEAITFFTDEELETAGLEFPKHDPRFVKARGVLEGADQFDAGFFGLKPREAEVLDPQHRVFLECAWEALESAGCDPQRFGGAIGVFAGMSMNTYLAHNLLTRPELIAQLNDHQLMLGNDKDFLPTRVSYKLNLRGPSLNIQTACSTSLVAVCVACQNLLHHECDLALAGAVSITFPQKRGYVYQQGGIASPDGHCRAFDAQAAGTVAGEGAGVVVLKRLADALAGGDTIYGVIKGFAINNDGANKVGFTAPSVEGQAEVISTAQAMAGFAPETIGYLEAHGTGTPLGDPIEIEGLTKAFRAGTAKKTFCAVGSVKSNVGHLDTAAGVTGLIKTALALHHKTIPPSLHFDSPNPQIDFAESPFFVNTKLAAWPGGATRRRAGVSSFGIGGTNAHVVLEEAPAAGLSTSSRPVQLLVLSAKTESSLDQATANLAAHLKQNPALNLADVARTLQTGRGQFAHRRMLVCRDTGDAAQILEARDAKRMPSRAIEVADPLVVFMFPGQGAQQADMARELYEHESVFREQVDCCCERLQPHVGFDLRAVLYPAADRVEEARRQLTQTAVTQPALFVIEYALAKLWMQWGVRPEAMIGHSIGEYVAACLAGVFSLDEALGLVAARGRMMQELPAGTMLAVRLPENELQPLLPKNISLAAINAPSLCVVSGPTGAIDDLQGALEPRGVAASRLLTSHAFHSAMMDSLWKPFAELVGGLKLCTPQIPFISNVTGTWISNEEATDPHYWAKHLRQTVRFADGVAELFTDPNRILLEVGPGQTLSQLVKQHPKRGARRVIVSSLRHPKDSAPDYSILLNALGWLWLSGAEIDWKGFYQSEQRRCVALPTYAFERKRYFIEPAKSIRRRTNMVTAETPERAEQIPEASHRPPGSATAEVAGPTKTVATLRTLLSELSGLDAAAIGDRATFTEMGFESLFLTQLSVAIEKGFGVRVAFRQFLEDCSTLEALAAHLDPGGSRGDESQAATADREQSPPEPVSRIPLTESQRELWFASQMSDAASCAYNECRLLRLRGPLNTVVLLAALEQLVERHEALRITFAPSGDFQHIQPALKPDVAQLDWSELDGSAQTAQLDLLQKATAATPFDLVSGPLFRARLIRLGDQSHVLALVVHHLVCDGHALGILLRELGALYAVGCRGGDSELPAPPPWSEFVRQQIRRREGPEREAHARFWLQQFADGAPVLELPSDQPRPREWQFDGALESRLLPASLGEGLKQLSAQNGCTLFNTLLAACAILLHKLAGQPEIVIGIPIADRAMTGGESVVGHCINFVPLRVELDQKASFAEQLAVAQKLFFNAYGHQDYPFGSLIQKLELSRDANRMPLVSATFNLQWFAEPLAFPGLQATLEANPHCFTNFDLGFNVTEINGALQFDCRYIKSLFAAETIRRWLGHFQTLLESVVANPRQPIAGLTLLSAAERRTLQEDWSGPKAQFPCEKCVHQLFEEQAARNPDAIAVVGETQCLSYAELDRRANRLAGQLRSLGVGPEVLVGLCLERSPEMIVALLGILKAGGAYVPLDAAYPTERLKFILQDAQVPVLVTQRSLRDHFRFGLPRLQVLCVDDAQRTSGLQPDEAAPQPEARDPKPSDLAYVIYTSGSTGQPKGVLVTHQNVTRLFQATQTWYRFDERDVWTMFHSVAFDFSVWEIWGALLFGGRLVVVPYLTSRSPEAFLELLERERVTVLNQTPSAFRQLIQAEQRAGPSRELALRSVIFGGEALEMRSLKPWFDRHGDRRPQLVNMYGITETTVHVTYRPLGVSDLGSGSVIGTPIPDLQIYILDAGRQPVPVGVPGELYVGGAGVARGYLNRPELTAERFIPHPSSQQPEARLYKTGDLARWRPDGDIEYLGRSDHQVKIRGHRIEPGEVEAALARHPAVRECVVLAREEAPGDRRLAAYVVAELDRASVTFGELRDFLKAQLPDYMVPSALVFLDALPLTPNGKVDRQALPEPEQVRLEPGGSFAAPRTPTELALAEIWRKVLRLEHVGVHDNFFALGGHSLLMTQVISRVRLAFQVELPIRKFFESPTVAELSSAIEHLLAVEISRLSDEEARRLAHSPG